MSSAVTSQVIEKNIINVDLVIGPNVAALSEYWSEGHTSPDIEFLETVERMAIEIAFKASQRKLGLL